MVRSITELVTCRKVNRMAGRFQMDRQHDWDSSQETDTHPFVWTIVPILASKCHALPFA